LTWNYGTAAGPAARTGSAAPRTPLRNPPLHGFAQNQVWYEIIALAYELLAWMQMLAFTGLARHWEPKRLRRRIFAVVGRIARGDRLLWPHLAQHWPSARDLITAVSRLNVLAPG
jgi:hypothetical protein